MVFKKRVEKNNPNCYKKSETDDYAWGWLLIKTMTVEETGREVPGVSKVVYETNHRFGLVAVTVFLKTVLPKK